MNAVSVLWTDNTQYVNQVEGCSHPGVPEDELEAFSNSLERNGKLETGLLRRQVRLSLAMAYLNSAEKQLMVSNLLTIKAIKGASNPL